MILVDTGPLVASQLKTDHHFSWARQQFKSLSLPFFTCEAVLAEAAYLLQRDGVAAHALSDLVISGVIRINFDISSEVQAVHNLLKKYQDIPIDWADACLVRMSELNQNSRVLTIDSDFRIFRRNRTEVIDVIMPT